MRSKGNCSRLPQWKRKVYLLSWAEKGRQPQNASIRIGIGIGIRVRVGRVPPLVNQKLNYEPGESGNKSKRTLSRLGTGDWGLGAEGNNSIRQLQMLIQFALSIKSLSPWPARNCISRISACHQHIYIFCPQIFGWLQHFSTLRNAPFLVKIMPHFGPFTCLFTSNAFLVIGQQKVSAAAAASPQQVRVLYPLHSTEPSRVELMKGQVKWLTDCIDILFGPKMYLGGFGKTLRTICWANWNFPLHPVGGIRIHYDLYPHGIRSAFQLCANCIVSVSQNIIRNLLLYAYFLTCALIWLKELWFLSFSGKCIGFWHRDGNYKSYI